jgi:hypothetical protein
MKFLRDNLRLIAVATAVAVISGSTVAVAGSLITSQDIQDGTIRPVDVGKKLRKKIYRNTGTLAARVPGENGTPGANGKDGAPGLNGVDADFEAGNWGVITRNTIGSPVADLRAGPFGSFGVTGPQAAPPFGEGSLGIAVARDTDGVGSDDTEKVAFGNEVDFFGDEVTDVDEVGFRVFQTGENCGLSGGVCTRQANMPNITFEVDPNHTSSTSNYSSLVFVPTGIPAAGINQWSGYIDATLASEGEWYFTNGTVGTSTGCGISNMCTFSELQTALAADDVTDSTPATIYTAAVSKGRDNAWVGAVDGLQINDTIFDFEPLGVEALPAS